jgi:N-formylglutamate deformylase
MNTRQWDMVEGKMPIVAAAIHNGHEVRKEVANLLALDDSERLREEDPYTGAWTGLSDSRIIVKRSRFEVDLNRPREEAVYMRPQDAWGLEVWKHPLPAEVVVSSLKEHDLFYAHVQKMFENIKTRFDRFVVFDLHAYNHRRLGSDGPAADPADNPEINVGTGTLDRKRWAGVVDRFVEDLRAFDFFGRRLDVRENVKFRGGYFPRWVHEHFPTSACVLSIEVKKFFMDEWSGNAEPATFEKVKEALASTVPGIIEQLDGIPPEC